jgi:glucose-1-phosphate adenylyltransferase
VVRDSIVMFDSVIRSSAVVDRSILDKEVVVGQSAIIGNGPYDDRPNKQEPTRLNTGITVVGKRAVIPRGAQVGRNVRIAADIRTTDFVKKIIKSGESVERKAGGKHAHDHGRVAGEVPASARAQS